MWNNAQPAERLLDFHDVSASLRCYKPIRTATTQFKKLIAKDANLDVFLHSDSGNSETIRKARVQVFLAVYALRLWWRMLHNNQLWVCLTVDASPPERGIELIAASFELHIFSSSPLLSEAMAHPAPLFIWTEICTL